MKVCKICGREFEPMHPNSKYCSELCSSIGRKKKVIAWKEQNAGRMTKYMRDYRKKKAAQY